MSRRNGSKKLTAQEVGEWLAQEQGPLMDDLGLMLIMLSRLARQLPALPPEEARTVAHFVLDGTSTVVYLVLARLEDDDGREEAAGWMLAMLNDVAEMASEFGV